MVIPVGWSRFTRGEMETKVGRRYDIRRMRPKDIRSVMALEKRVFSDPWPENAYVQELYFNPNAYYFVLYFRDAARLPWKQLHKDKIFGYVGVRVESGRGHISTLAVHPDWQGRGFGELLLITVLQTAVKMEAEQVTLEVRVSNKVAQALYHKYAFRTLMDLPAYYKNGEDAALMASDLSEADYGKWLQEQRRKIECRIRKTLAQLPS